MKETICRHGIEQGRQDALSLGVKKGIEIGACSMNPQTKRSTDAIHRAEGDK